LERLEMNWKVVGKLLVEIWPFLLLGEPKVSAVVFFLQVVSMSFLPLSRTCV
jgi:hypothetical protein